MLMHGREIDQAPHCSLLGDISHTHTRCKITDESAYGYNVTPLTPQNGDKELEVVSSPSYMNMTDVL